ncbi:MAG TPA: DUF3151 family protein [Microthrixaceae bacterium]|nr:DUF3151 family protein [Microthrixaceae bacterium]
MTDLPVNLSSSGPPETVLDPEPEALRAALDDAAASPDPRAATAEVAAANPRSLLAWAAMGAHGRDDIERYAYFRVGYHRGLDRLRQSGWRGTGYVRFEHEPNRGFLRALEGLRAAAEAIGEDDEAERCATFLRQLDPAWPPPGSAGTAGTPG